MSLLTKLKNEISFYNLIDNRNGNKKVDLIRAYFVYSFYNIENDEKIHLKNGETLNVKRCWLYYERHRNGIAP